MSACMQRLGHAHLAHIARHRHQVVLQDTHASGDELEDARLRAARLGALEALLAQLDHCARLVSEYDVLGRAQALACAD